MEDSDLSSVCDIYPAFQTSEVTIYSGVTREKLLTRGRCQQGTSDVSSDNNNARKLNTVDKDTNLSEQTLIGISVKSDHEDDKSDANEASTAPLDVSQVTLTGSTVNISAVTSGIRCTMGKLEQPGGHSLEELK